MNEAARRGRIFEKRWRGPRGGRGPGEAPLPPNLPIPGRVKALAQFGFVDLGGRIGRSYDYIFFFFSFSPPASPLGLRSFTFTRLRVQGSRLLVLKPEKRSLPPRNTYDCTWKRGCCEAGAGTRPTRVSTLPVPFDCAERLLNKSLPQRPRRMLGRLGHRLLSLAGIKAYNRGGHYFWMSRNEARASRAKT